MIRACLTYESSNLFDSWFELVHFATRPCLTNGSTLSDSIDPDRLMIRPRSTRNLTAIDSLFDPARPRFLRPNSNHDLTLFDLWFEPVRFSIRPCMIFTPFKWWLYRVRFMIRSCLNQDSTLFDKKFDPVRVMIWAGSTQVLAKSELWFDPNWLMIRPCLTHDWTLFESRFDPVWPMIRPWSINGLNLFIFRPRSTNSSTLFDLRFDTFRLDRPCFSQDLIIFDSWFDSVWLMTRVNLTHDSTQSDPSLIIWSYSTQDSNLFSTRFDPVLFMIRPFLTHDSTLFQPSFDHVWLSTPFNWLLDLVRLMI